MKIISLSKPAVCKGCGKQLPVGTKVKYYSVDKIYCETHSKAARDTTAETSVATSIPPSQPIPGTGTPTLDICIETIDTLQCLLADTKEKLKTVKALRRAFPIGESDSEGSNN